MAPQKKNAGPGPTDSPCNQASTALRPGSSAGHGTARNRVETAPDETPWSEFRQSRVLFDYKGRIA